MLLLLSMALLVLTVSLLAAGRGDDDGQGGDEEPRNEGAHVFESRPDLHPPTIEVVERDEDRAAGLLFVTPGNSRYGDTGPLIIDDEGEPVWVGSVPEGQNATTLKVQRYRGEQVLTWWEGTIDKDLGYGVGVAVIADQSYRRLATVEFGEGYDTDLHEFLITPRDTALLVSYRREDHDLSGYGGPEDGVIMNTLVREIDIETGEVLLHWDPLEHVPPDESYREADGDGAWDPYHVNAVDVDESGDLLVTARHTWAVYKVDGSSGELLWTLGGKGSDFELADDAVFAWPHDARFGEDGTINLFDNQAADEDEESERSRGLVLNVDEEAGTAEAVAEYGDGDFLAPSQGSLQALPGGGFLVGWGSKARLSEHDRDNALLFDARFYGSNQSYRAYRQAWTGRPAEGPLAVARTAEGETTVYASWNGATGVARWRLLAGTQPGALERVVTVERDGFETAIEAGAEGPYFEVLALDDQGELLGSVETAAPDLP